MFLPRSCCYQPRINSWFQLLNYGVGCHNTSCHHPPGSKPGVGNSDVTARHIKPKAICSNRFNLGSPIETPYTHTYIYICFLLGPAATNPESVAGFNC